MLLTLRTTHLPATDLAILLHQDPDRLQTFELPFGKAHVFYPEVSESACTAALLLDVDPAGQVDDRPYVASSFLAVAIARIFGSALGGRCERYPELAASPLPLEARVAVLPCRGGEGFLRRLFEPLGYAVTADAHPLDPAFPAWGPSRYFTVTLRASRPLSELLSHLCVLIPVADGRRDPDPGLEEIVRRGQGWIAAHPEREAIAGR
jgi:3' terminal RNA ribose 2'-O-methyltransferase Hen1